MILLAGFPLLLLIMLWTFLAGATAMQFPDADPVSAGWDGVIRYGHWVFIGTAIWFVIAWFFHQRMINAATGAHFVVRRQEPEIYNLLENLCISRGLPMPRLAIIETDALNAFASGIDRKNYTITLTRGIINSLRKDELETVIAHELTHIINQDVRLLVISIIFVGIISFSCEIAFRMMLHSSRFTGISNRRGRGGGAMLLLAFVILLVGYFLAILIRFAISRKREYLADAGAVELTKNPDALISALRKISGHAEIENVPDEVRQMFIENPPSISGLFSTHPPIEKRIEALVMMGGRDYARIDNSASGENDARKLDPWQQ